MLVAETQEGPAPVTDDAAGEELTPGGVELQGPPDQMQQAAVAVRQLLAA